MRTLDRIVKAGCLLVLCALTGLAHAQNPEKLQDEIARADAELFTAFNACDIETMAEMFAEDLEFFHDIAGVSNYAQTMQATKTNCDRQLGLKRELVEGSLEVYPIKDYGAIQKGKHTFCHLENGKNDCGTFGFLHVWKRTEEGWKIARVVSYGH